MYTLRDVAKKAGVSIATVSYCINNTKPILPETRAKIMKAIEELNYVPNAAARNLKKNTLSEIGIVFPDIDDFHYSEILKGIVSTVEAEDFSLNVAFSYNSPKIEQKIILDFISRNISGLIIISCQPNNTEFFRKSIVASKIPNFFIERLPQNIDTNFFAFDDYKTYYFLTKNLLSKGYFKIALLTGPTAYFPDYDNICGYTDAYEDMDLPFSPSWILETDMSKESAFKETMIHLIESPPQAIIAASESIAKGIVEALNLAKIEIPNQVLVLSMGEECWNTTNYLQNVIYTSRTAYNLGSSCAAVLIDDIRTHYTGKKLFRLYEDNIIHQPLDIPECQSITNDIAKPKHILRVLGPRLPSVFALETMSRQFSIENQVCIEFILLECQDLLNEILLDFFSDKPKYDLYIYDFCWFSYLLENNVLKDFSITEEAISELSKRYMNHCFENYIANGNCYGIPIIDCSHMLFYRKDLFENPNLKRQYRQMHNLSLRPPKTWKEFNNIAKFFTRVHNDNSPTLYGTSIKGSTVEELLFEFYNRIWSFQGGLYDSTGKLALNSAENIKTLKNLLETEYYIERNPCSLSVKQAFKDFGSGRTAMLISTGEYASQIRDGIHGNIISNIGYSQLPGESPLKISFGIGISNHTSNRTLIHDYLTWMIQRHTSYYLTILNGQSAMRYPFENHELLKLYPWLNLKSPSNCQTHKRYYPCKGVHRLISPEEIENILYHTFQDILIHGKPVPQALTEGQVKILKLFSSRTPS